jgi:hypothetical protein
MIIALISYTTAVWTGRRNKKTTIVTTILRSSKYQKKLILDIHYKENKENKKNKTQEKNIV